MQDKFARWIAAFSLLVSILGFVYTFYTSERGPLIGKPELKFSVSSKLGIENTSYGLLVFPTIEILNIGKVPATVGKMQVFLMLNSPNSASRKILFSRSYKPLAEKEFMAFGSFLVRPGDIWKANVSFNEDFTEEVEDKRADLDFRIGSYLQKQALDSPNKTPQIPLPDDLYKELKLQMTDQAKWLEKGEYRLLLMIWGGVDNKELLLRKGYKFRLSLEQLNGLKKYQLESYRCPPKFDYSKFMTFTVIAALTELTKEELQLLIDEYNKQPKPNIALHPTPERRLG
jgi:hypothetical protein